MLNIEDAMSSRPKSHAMTSVVSPEYDFFKAPPPSQPRNPIPKHQFEGHKQDVVDLIFLHDNVHIVSGSWDGMMRKWNCDTGLLVGKPWTGDGGMIHALALSPDGKTIACGRGNGMVQRWSTEGEMTEDARWTRTGNHYISRVKSLSWSPSGDYIASGHIDAIILIQKAESRGKVATESHLAGGTRQFAFGTGKLIVSPIKDRLEAFVTSLVWSSGGTKLYSASGKFVHIVDSYSGTLLYRFQHYHFLNTLLWDSESHKPLGQPFYQEGHRDLHCASFCGDGRYFAYGRDDGKITLFTIKGVAPELPSLASSCLEVDATEPLIEEERRDDPHGNFFQSSQSCHPSRSQRPHASSARLLWNILIPSRHRPTASESIALQQRSKRSLFAWQTGPQPVTVAAGRKNSATPVRTNTQTGQSSPATAQPTAQPNSTPQPQSRPQTTIQQPEDYGCWGNFCLALWCIPRRPRVVSTVQPTIS
ncbi:WD40-repeat-containing domain protein [Suillus americanus]|nr:WD40-repeat-containing domain protein [Suillus americanus]